MPTPQGSQPQQVVVDNGTFISLLQQRVGALEQEVKKDVSTTSAVITPGNLATYSDASGTFLQDSGISWQTVTSNTLALAGVQNELEPIAPAGQRDLWQYATGSPSSGFLRYVADTDMLFTVIGDVSLNAYSTNGGVTYTTCSYNIGPTQGSDVAFGNGVYLSVSVGGLETYTSPDGINWTKQTALPYAASCVHFFKAAGLFLVGIDASASQGIMTSKDGLTWTVRTAGVVNAWDIVDNGVLAVAFGGSAPYAMSSPDGINWTNTPSTIAATRGVAWSAAKAQWLMNTLSATGGFVSTDGVHWTATGAIFPTTPAGNSIFYVAGSYNRWYIGGTDTSGNYSLYSTPDISIPFVGTHLDGAVTSGLEYSALYVPAHDKFNIGSTNVPHAAYGTVRPYDLKVLSDNIRVRGMPVDVAKYSTYSTFAGPNSTTSETTISTPTTAANVLGNLAYQANQPVGSILTFDLNLSVSSAGGDTLTIKYKMNGGSALISQGVVIPASGSAQAVNVRTRMTIGLGSTVQISQIATVSGQASTIAQANVAFTNTQTNIFTATATWGGSASTCTMNQLIATAQFPNGQ